MSYRSSADRGRATVNAALNAYRQVPGIPVADALEAFQLAEDRNELAAAVRRHPSWNPQLEGDIRYQPDPEWTTEEIRFARLVLLRTVRAFGPHPDGGVRHLRTDGRWEIADHEDGNDLYCEEDDWCILEHGHPGNCDGDRELWCGPDTLYPAAPSLVSA